VKDLVSSPRPKSHEEGKVHQCLMSMMREKKELKKIKIITQKSLKLF
jgi:hypothetical protein